MDKWCNGEMVPNIILAISPVDINVAFQVIVILEPSLNTINGSAVVLLASHDDTTTTTMATVMMSMQQ